MKRILSVMYYFNLEKEFVPIYNIFPEITKEKINKVKHIVDKIKPEVFSNS